MTQENTPPQKDSFGDRMAIAFMAFVRALIRLLLIVLVAILIGLVAYYGVPLLYRQYILPAQQAINQLEEAQSHQQQTNQQFTQRLSGQQDRLQSLELQSDTMKQTVSELQAGLSQVESTQQASTNVFQVAQAALQATASAGLQNINTNFDAMEKKLNSLSAALDNTNRNLEAIATEVHAEDRPVAVLRRDLQLVKAMEFLTRSRLFLAENNLGLAKEDIQAARDLLSDLQNQAPFYQKDTISAIIARLDSATGNLPGSPVLAADDLEIAWQLLRIGLPIEGQLTPVATTLVSTAQGTAIAPGVVATSQPPTSTTPTPTRYLTATSTPTSGRTQTATPTP